MKLLQGEQAQGVAHNHSHALLAGATCHGPLQAADRQGVGRQTQVGLRFPSAGGKPEQVSNGSGILAAIRVMQVGQRGQVQQDKG